MIERPIWVDSTMFIGILLLGLFFAVLFWFNSRPIDYTSEKYVGKDEMEKEE